MRIAIAYDCLFPWTKGGGERQYRCFAEEFMAAGHQVTYLTRQQWDGDPPQIEGLQIEVISHDRNLYDENGVRLLGPALRFAHGLFAHLLVHRADYDAVLISATPATNVVAARAALLGTPTVLCVDWLEVWRHDQWLEYSGPWIGRVANALQGLAIHSSPIATCHSQTTARRLRERGFKSEPLVSPGLIEKEPLSDPVLGPSAAPVVVYIGRHIPDKRVEAIPGAIAYARQRIPALTAVIFGEGPSREDVRKAVADLNLVDAVTLPGFVSQQELDEALRTAACLVNPSAREGYGLVVVEACAAATPAVVVEGDDNASVELVEDGINGRVAKSTEPTALGQAIVDVVLAGRAMRETTHRWFAQASRTRSIRASARQIVASLERAVAGSSALAR